MSILLDFYAEALTDKQREVLEYYYNEDLSLSEIAYHVGITRQGVRDSIKRGETVLYDLEDKFGLAKRFRVLQEGLNAIVDYSKKIDHYNSQFCYSKEISSSVSAIQEIAKKLAE